MDKQTEIIFAKQLRNRFISFIQYFTIAKQSQARSSLEDDEWQKTFDAMNAAVWIIDDNHFVLRSNKAAEELFNKSNDEIIGKRCWELVHGTEAPIPECPILKARKSLKRESMELPIGDGWFEVIVDPILDDKGNFAKAIHIVTDITNHKLMDERLKRNEALLSDAQQLSKIGGWEWDVGRQKMYWTKELYHLHKLDSTKFEPGVSFTYRRKSKVL